MNLSLKNNCWQKILHLFSLAIIISNVFESIASDHFTLLNGEHIVIYLEHSSGPIAFHVEIASTPQALAQGLMNRSHLDKDAGMLFVFPKIQKTSFWMKDTYIALDLVFMDENFQVVQVYEDAQPLDLEKIESDQPIKYVLEISAGSIQHYKIQKGNSFKTESHF